MSKLSVKKLEKSGLPKSVADRLWIKKTLWLVVMHREDISKIHIADLRGKFQYDNTFDIVEMRAIWACLPDWGSGNPKAEWRDDFKRKLNELAHEESLGTLPVSHLLFTSFLVSSSVTSQSPYNLYISFSSLFNRRS